MDKTNENTREQTYVTIGHIEGDAFREQVTTLLINEKLVKHCECCGRLIRNFEVPDKTGYQAFGREFGKNNRKFKLNAGRPLLGEDYNKGKEYVKYILAEASTIVKNCNFVPDPH